MMATRYAGVTAALFLAAALFALAPRAASGDDQAKAPKPQTTCPVMGAKIDKNVYADYNGKRIYFCCADCPATFKKDPEKYIKKLEAEGVTLEATPKPQTTCPVMGGKIDKNVYVDYKGYRIYFCCAGCPPTFNKDPEKYLKKLQDEGVTLEGTPKPQTTCPVMGGKIDKNVYVDYKGYRIYFCCAGCPPTFNKDPEKYLKKLQDEGVTLAKTAVEGQRVRPADEHGHH